MSFFPRLRFRKNATEPTYTEPRIDFVEGDGVTITVTDDPVAEEIHVQFDAEGAGPHNILSAEHPDTDAYDVPNDGDVLTWDEYIAMWVAAAPAAGLVAHDIDGVYHDGFPGGTTTFLRADGTFAAPPGGGGGGAPGAAFNVNTTSSDDTAAWGDLWLVDASGGDVTITLSAASSGEGQEVIVKKTDDSVNIVRVEADGADTIDGVSYHDITEEWGMLRVISNG